jgi:RNA polymerase sigma-70 factor (ECF subfamily)
MSDPPDDHGAVLRGFLAEDPSALETVRGWVSDLVGARWSFPDPEAVVQEIVLELLRLSREGRVRRGTMFRSFVLTVARNSCVDHYRKQRLRATVDKEDGFFESLGDPAPDPEEEARRRQRLEQVRFIVQALDPGCRELLRRFFGEGLEGGEIARRMGISPGNVRVRIHRCLEKARGIRREFLPGVS